MLHEIIRAQKNFLKRVFGIACCIYFLTISAFIIRIFAESLVLIYFPDIHIEFVILVFIAITAITNLFGFKSISRVTLITLPIILISMVIIFISSASNFVPQRALPLLGYGAYDTFVSGLGNIFAYSRLKRIGGSLGTDGMINRSRKMIAPLKSQRAYSNSKNLELGFERV